MFTVYFVFCCYVFFFKQTTAYEMRISDWSSDVCSSDLDRDHAARLEVNDREAAVCGVAAQHRLIVPGREARGLELEVVLVRPEPDRKSVVKGKSGSVRVDLGGRRIIKKKTICTRGRRHTHSTYTRPIA